MTEAVRIAEEDNVAVALCPISAGTAVLGVVARGEVPAGHKIALGPIRAGETVVKFGYPIGLAARDIAPGEHVHGHNLESALEGPLRAGVLPRQPLRQRLPPSPLPTFQGFRRPDGRVGIRNEIWIVNTVACVNNAAERIAAAARAELVRPGSSVEGVYSFSHPYGCSQLGGDLEKTQRILAGLVRHPNAAGVLVLGLGCESNQTRLLLEKAGPMPAQRVLHFNAQDVGDEIEEGLACVRQLAQYACSFTREEIPASELVLAMKCGGSDGLSGITANPLVGRIADRLCAMGGTVLLSEVPEMFGAEHILLARACSPQVVADMTSMVNRFREYFRSYDEPIDENPSPGNKDGGITTLAEKSLGCVQKGGQAPVACVLGYGEPAPPRRAGIALVDAPGNDGVSSTAMVAAGAHIVLFTTGRGTPMGFPAPTIKISTSSDLARRKPAWIDFDAGPIALGTAGFDTLAEGLMALVFDVASGRVQTRTEQSGFREISIWKDGVTL